MILSIQKNKITFLINTLSGGGAEGVCINIANALAKKGYDIDLVVLNLKGNEYVSRIDSRLNFVNLDVSNSRYAFGALKSYIKSSGMNVVLSFNYELSVLLVLVRYLSELKYKIIGRNIIALSQKKKNNKGFWRKYIVAKLIDVFFVRVDHVVNQCLAMEADLIEVYPLLKGKTSAIYNPINSTIQNSFDSDVGFTKEEKYILCVGRLETQKGFDLAIKSFFEFSKTQPEFRLKIVGQGTLEEPLKKLVRSLDIQHKVDFEGFKKNTSNYFLNATCTLLTSNFEGFPNVLLESICLGTPVVSVDCNSGPREIVVDGINGKLVTDWDAISISKALCSVCLSDWDRKKLNESVAKFHLDEILVHYQSILIPDANC